MQIEEHALAAGDGFFHALAERFLERAGAAASADFSAQLFFVPSLSLAGECRAALVAAARRPMLLPRFDTLSRWAFNTPLPDFASLPAAQPESARLLLLYDTLAARGWFDPAALWNVAAELAALADELSSAAVTLPADLETLLEQLQRAYELTAAKPLFFEARLVHEMWHALSACGQPDRPSLYRLRLARLSASISAPRAVLLAAPPEEALSRAEMDFFERCAARQNVLMFYPAPRRAQRTPLARLLSAAWPEETPETEEAQIPLIDRARKLSATLTQSPLEECFRLAPASGREAEAQTIVAQTLAWLREGRQRIALIAADRLSARRVRALLEREQLLVDDETGWKLSTSRAAALVDALLECAAGNAARGVTGENLLDLLKSPFLLPAVAEKTPSAIPALERALRDPRNAGGRRGMAFFRRALRNEEKVSAELLDRIDAALHLLGAAPAPLARWLERLEKALEAIGAQDTLAADAAGAALLDLLGTRREELSADMGAGSPSSRPFSFSAWRAWLDRELENANFHESRIGSPVVMLPLSAARLRRFDAAVLIGGGAASLSLSSSSVFFNQAVRRDLGLPTRETREAALLRDLESLLSTVPRVLVTWCLEQKGEANPLAPPLDLLAALHDLAWPEAAKTLKAESAATLSRDRDDSLSSVHAPAPSLLPQDFPQRLPVAALSTLMSCPYRFFARYILRLGEMEEIEQTFGKKDYGTLVHRILEIFHRRHPQITALSPEAAAEALEAIGNEVFAQAEAEDFFVAGWRLRWQACLPAYLEWQRENEAAGWRWHQAEVKAACLLPLEDGGALEIHGRIDRVDENDTGGCALFDYKTKSASALKKAEDLQLPLYALMHGKVEQAAYLALDETKVQPVAASLTPENAEASEAPLLQHFSALFSRIHAGANLPAHGVDTICAYCEIHGLCRVPWARRGNV
ncbi:MAG: PD-(D/E)XK nuclease family protein [Betaproteobacteria bacterium]|nr:PD-(D/E)XK nuclease family protein [Betaproteobacteria bacterium]